MFISAHSEAIVLLIQLNVYKSASTNILNTLSVSYSVIPLTVAVHSHVLWPGCRYSQTYKKLHFEARYSL